MYYLFLAPIIYLTRSIATIIVEHFYANVWLPSLAIIMPSKFISSSLNDNATSEATCTYSTNTNNTNSGGSSSIGNGTIGGIHNGSNTAHNTNTSVTAMIVGDHIDSGTNTSNNNINNNTIEEQTYFASTSSAPPLFPRSSSLGSPYTTSFSSTTMITLPRSLTSMSASTSSSSPSPSSSSVVNQVTEPLSSVRNNLMGQNYLRYRISKRQQQTENYSRVSRAAAAASSANVEDSENLVDSDVDMLVLYCGDLMKSPLPYIHPLSLPNNISPQDPRIRKIQRNRRRITIYSRYLIQDKNPRNRNVQERISKLLRNAITDEINEWDSIYQHLESTSSRSSSLERDTESSSSLSSSPPTSSSAATVTSAATASSVAVAASATTALSSLQASSKIARLSNATQTQPPVTVHRISSRRSMFKLEPFQFTVITKLSSDLCPKARSGHRIVTDNLGNLYSFGGYNKNAGDQLGTSQNSPLFRELWKFDYGKLQWDKMPANGDEPQQLVSHCMGALNGKLYCFGGTSLPYGENSSNRVIMYDIARQRWEIMKPESDPSQLPQEMYGQAMAIDETRGEIFVAGGTSGHHYTLDVHRFNLYTRRWTLLHKHARFEGEPGARYRHEITLYNNKLYMFAGGTNNICYDFETLPVFDLATCNWESQPTKPDGYGRYPQARKCHSLSVIDEDCFVCGGTDSNQVLGDVWHLSLRTFQWTLVKQRMPYPVYFHSACLDRSGRLTIFGGVEDIEGNRRNNKLQTMWVRIPALRTITMMAIRYYFQEGLVNKKSLIETGLLEAKNVANHIVQASSMTVTS